MTGLFRFLTKLPSSKILLMGHSGSDGTVAVFNILRRFGTSNKYHDTSTTIKYPQARRDECVVDDYHGDKVQDPYRWLEDPHSEETKTFVDNQNAVTQPFLKGSPYWSLLNKRLNELWNYPKYTCPSRHGNKYFFEKNSGLQNQSVLYMQDCLEAEPEVFLDPNMLSEDGTVCLTMKAFSEDGSILAYGLSSSGSDWISIHFKDVSTGNTYPEILTKVKFSTITWTHDNKGIFYGHYPDEKGVFDGSETERVERQKLFYHRIGTEQRDDLLVVEFPEEPQFRMTAHITQCGRYLIVCPLKGCRDNLIYFCDLASSNYEIKEKMKFTQVVTTLDADYQYVSNLNNRIFFRTNKDSPNYRIIEINFDAPEKENWTTLIAEHETDVLSWAVGVNNDKLIVCYIRHVKSVLQLHNMAYGYFIYTFPHAMGMISDFSGNEKLSEVFYSITTFLTPCIMYRCDLRENPLNAKVFREETTDGFSPENYTTEQVFYVSKDGTKIPMFIVHKKDLVLNGGNPCLLYGYGGFNISMQPFFSVPWVVFMQHFNGVLAIPNIRGGGEYGEKWHNAGRLKNKQNSYDDFHAAAEYLIKNKFTKSDLLTIKGGSNGGLLVGVSITQRPDLYGAAVAQVGVLDMFRFHKFTIGYAWTSDFGCADNKDEFEYLRRYSPLHNIRIPPGNIQYPATLLLTADHDDRVVPLHSLKFIAELQHTMQSVPKQKNLLLIRVETKAGHGGGKPMGKIIEEYCDILSFIQRCLNLKFVD